MHRRTTSRRNVATRRAQPLRHGARRDCSGEPRQSHERLRLFVPGPWRARRPAPFPGEGEARHLSLHGWRTVADGDVRLQAAAQPSQRRAVAGLRAAGAAAHRNVRQSVVAAARRVAVRVQPARGKRHLGQRSPASHREDRGRTVHRPLDVHRRDQPRPRDHVLPDRLADRRPSQHGLVDSLRVGQRQRGSPGVCRAHHSRQGRSTVLFAPLGKRLPSGAVSGPAVPERQGRGVVSGQPGWGDAREPPAAARSVAGPARARCRESSATRKSTRASPSTRCRTGCRRACPA